MGDEGDIVTYLDPKWQKMAKRLLMDPDGRKALQEYGITVEMVGEQKPDNPDKPIVVILCPTYRAPEPKMQDALSAMVNYTREKGIATVYGGAPIQSSVVHWSRNGLISEHLKSGKPWTHVLFIDDDITVQPDHLEKLLSHKVDIIAGLCTRRQDPPMPNIRFLAEDGHRFEQIFEWPNKQLLEVGAVGTGLMLISKHALEQIATVYFDCLWEQEFYGFAGERLEQMKAERLKHFDESKMCFWFRFLPTINPPVEYGEDISFCWLAKKYCGIPIYVDTTVQPGHLGLYDYGIKDFMPFQADQKREYRAKQMYNATMGRPVYGIRKPEQENGRTHSIDVLIPTRDRHDKLWEAIASLKNTACGRVNFLVRVDDDDAYQYLDASGLCTILHGPRYGYEGLHKYYNELAEQSTGDWLLLWNDDAIMETEGWDEKVHQHAGGLKVLNFTGTLNTFPAISRELYETLGHFSLQAHCDSWIQVVGRLTGIEESCPLSIKHTPREQYDTAKDFFTPDNFELLEKDIEKVEAALKRVPVVA